MKKIWLFITMAVLALTPAFVSAQQSPLLDGQQHLYTVQLRSDEKSLVYARIVFTNPSTDKDLSTYKFSMPDDTKADNLTAQQVLAQKKADAEPCTTYETVKEWRTRTSGSLGSYDSTKQCVEPRETTIIIQNEDYNYTNDLSDADRYYSYRSYDQSNPEFKYSDANVVQASDGYTVNLPSPIKPKKQGSILLSFTTGDFINSNLFGRYDYNVRTLLTSQMINKATVSINFDDDMYSKQAKQQRTYTDSSSNRGSSSHMSGASVAREDSSLDTLKDSIGTGGTHIKSQSSLLPGDMLRVSGVFATSKIGLLTTELFIGLGILLLLAVIVGVGIWRYRRWRKAHPKTTDTHQSDKESSNDSAKLNQFTENNLASVAAIPKTVPELTSTKKWTIIAVVSSISIVGTLAVTFVGAALLSVLTNSTDTTEIVPLFWLAILFMGWLLLPLLYTLRYGVRFTFNWAVIHTLVTLALILVIVSLSFFQEVETGGSPISPGYNY